MIFRIKGAMPILILATLFASLAHSQTARTDKDVHLLKSANEVYQEIKRLEENFPIPTPYATVAIGTFNASTGTFIFDENVMFFLPEVPPNGSDSGDVPPGKPRPRGALPRVMVNAVNVGLTFRVTGSTSDYSVTVNGIGTINAPLGETTVTVNVGAAPSLRWSIRSGTKIYRDRLMINRPPIVGAGAFTIPALPIAILYEPPPDSRMMNNATYSETQSVGTTERMSFSEENSTTTPVRAQFDTVTDIKDAMNNLATVIQYAPEVPYATQIASGLKTIANGLGDVKAEKEAGMIVTKDKSLSLVETGGVGLGTGENDGGPGIGDKIFYLKNAKLVWLAHNGTVRLALLGYDKKESPAVKYLRGPTNETGLSAVAINDLLQLDPFVRTGYVPINWQPQLTEPRFRKVDNYSVNAGPLVLENLITITQADLEGKGNFTTRIEEYRVGFLSFLGLGITENRKLKATFTNSSSREVTVGRTIKHRIELYATIDEYYSVAVHYDRLFGTFAVKEIPNNPEASISGRVISQGRPVVGQLIRLSINGENFWTNTDVKGHYAFRAATIKGGNAQLSFGGMKKTVRLAGKPLRSVDFIMP